MMRPRWMFMLALIVVLLISACQGKVKTTTDQPGIPTPSLVKTKIITVSPTVRSQFSAQGESTHLAKVTDQPEIGEASVRLSLSPQAMEGTKSYAKEYSGVKEELFYTGGFGGRGPLCYLSEMNQPPMIGYNSIPVISQSIELCLIGFPKGKSIQIDLYAPDGNLMGAKQFPYEESNYTIFIEKQDNKFVVDSFYEGLTQDSANVLVDVNVQFIKLWNPVGLPTGNWRVEATSGDVAKEVTIPVGTLIVNQNRISTLPDLTINPFEDRSCGEYHAGDTVYVAGSRFQPNQQIPLGIYYATNQYSKTPKGEYGDLYLRVFGTLVAIAEGGDFLIQYLVPADASDGEYVIDIDQNNDNWIDYPGGGNCFNIKTGNGTPTPKAGPPDADTSFCKGAPTTRLKVGDLASISLMPPDPNTVREKPGKKQTRLGQLKPGERIEILDGPRCVDGWIWWKVISLETGLDGWTAEGDMKNYWIVPGY